MFRRTVPRATTSRPIVLERTAHRLRIPAGAAVLRQHLACTRRLVSTARGPHGYTQGLLPYPLFEIDEHDQAMLLAPTLLPVVELALRQAGRRVKIRTYDLLPPLPLGKRDFVERLGVEDEPLLDLVAQHDRGLVRYQPQVQPALLIAQLAHAYPNHTFMIAATRADDAERLTRQLQTLLSRSAVTRLVGDDNPAEVGRLAVGTYAGLTHSAVGLEQRDFLIYVDAREGIGTVGRQVHDRAFRARVFGLLAATTAVAPFEADQLRTVFGFAEATIPRHNYHERRVQVEQGLRITQPTLPAGKLDVYALKRDGVWRHHFRNRLLVKAAQGALLASPRDGSEPRTARRVVVLVDSVEHGLALARRLPEAVVLADEACCTTGLMKQAKQRLRQGNERRCGDWSLAVATPTGLGGVDFNRVSTVIRAEGGTGLPAIAPEQLVVRNDQPQPPLRLVDVDDQHHATLQQWSEQRLRAYRQRGWLAAGEDPITVRAQQFLEERPDVREMLASSFLLRQASAAIA